MQPKMNTQKWGICQLTVQFHLAAKLPWRQLRFVGTRAPLGLNVHACCLSQVGLDLPVLRRGVSGAPGRRLGTDLLSAVRLLPQLHPACQERPPGHTCKAI